MLVFLVAVPVLLLVYIGIQRRRQRYALRYANLSLLKEAVGSGPGIRRHIPPALFLLSLTAMIVALARPAAEVKVPSFDGTVILTIDVSGSMRADDITPSRIEAAKEAARNFIQEEPAGARIGVVAFSGFAALIQAPTSDKDAAIAAIDQLEPQRSTAIGEGMLTAMKALDPSLNTDAAATAADQSGGQGAQQGFGRRRAPGLSAQAAPITPTTPLQAPGPALGSPGIIILLSDGQSNTGADPMVVAPLAKARNIPIYTVGIGTSEGSVLRGFGRGMRVRLDEATLQQIADITGGQYFNAQSAGDLRSIYQKLGRTLGVRTEHTEITAYFTAVAAVLAAAGGILSLLWFSRLP
jgi:Ca-activated chloride channel family protein